MEILPISDIAQFITHYLALNIDSSFEQLRSILNVILIRQLSGRILGHV